MASGRTGSGKTPTKPSGSPAPGAKSRTKPSTATAAGDATSTAKAGAASRPAKPVGPVKGAAQTPQQKVAAMRRKAARRQRRNRFLVIGTIVVVVAGAGTAIGVYYGTRSDPLANVQTFTNTRNHVQGTVKYAQNPPAGGDHNPVWLNCGVYNEPVPNENAVHDLEHGAVWITYRPDLPKADIDKLVDKVTGQTYETLSPYPGLPAPVVVTAWDTQLKLTGVNDPGLDAFIKKYKLGPQTPELGASCSGGTGTPVG
ncbi:DUF3105 domain-containing protein [Jatrophihabitans sp. YIM 134969]